MTGDPCGEVPASDASPIVTERANGSEDAERSGDVEDADSAVDELLRAIAHAPSRTPWADPGKGTRWGEGGRYVLERRLGRGGMGVVYLATDTVLARQVALKVLHVDDAAEGDDVRRARLVREARLAARIEHERVARIYDVGEHDDRMFVAMELVRGETLRAWMAQPRATAEVLAIVLQIAEGLAVLHAAGVVHRDLKPENVMLAATGVKLLDFGLAGHVDVGGEAGRAASGAVGEATQSSAYMGTPGYMAPEQYAGKRADERADVFALGIVAFELVTGSRPFRGPTMLALLSAIHERPKRLDAQQWGATPRWLTDAIDRMLDPDPTARFANGQAVLEELREGATHATDAPREEAPRWRRRIALASAASAIVALVVMGPRLARALALRAALAKPPPAGMALVNEGAMVVGQTAEVAAQQCKDLGPSCNPRVMNYQVPAVTVTTAPFYLDVREVTNREMVDLLNKLSGVLHVDVDRDNAAVQYVRFNSGLGKGEEHLLYLHETFGGVDYSKEAGFTTRPGRAEWPVNQVPWHGAHAYCEGVGKRLPTENEWEAAARGRANRPYPWGADPPRCGDTVLASDGFQPTIGDCPTLKGPRDVGTSPQDVTPEGIHDLAGNVTEWVSTVYTEGDRASTTEADAPEKPHVLRGGSFFLSVLARTSMRNNRPSAFVGRDVGFRCAADLQLTHDETKKGIRP